MPNDYDDDLYLYDLSGIPSIEDVEKEYDKMYCNHEWKGTLLIYSTVYDCMKCGIKKEDQYKKKD